MAQHSTDGPSTDGEVEAKKKTGALGKSETMRKSAERIGPLQLDATRFGDWEKNGRCIDF